MSLYPPPDEFLSRLRTLIGRHLDFQGRPCQIVDVLEDGPQLVLRVHGENVIQPDQWGEAHRRTPETFTLTVFDTEDGSLNPQIEILLSG